ncbi:MAG: hypothetical protein LBM93_13485 [Oscillospiraceae bacterium]|nr:hypothetical protein [Oscillospiraceae bacterium]
MRKFKKLFAGMMAMATLAVGMTGFSASAYTASNSNSIFTWTKSGFSSTVKITNTSGISRYAFCSNYHYSISGAYLTHGSQSKTISDGQYASVSASANGTTSVVFNGGMYPSSTNNGPLLVSWTKSL